MTAWNMTDENQELTPSGEWQVGRIIAAVVAVKILVLGGLILRSFGAFTLGEAPASAAGDKAENAQTQAPHSGADAQKTTKVNRTVAGDIDASTVKPDSEGFIDMTR